MIRPHYVPLYQGICHSEKMADLKEKDARFFFCALLTYCDSYGRMDARPRSIHSKVWSMFGTTESVPKLLADLERVGLIVRYEHEGQPVLAIPDWEEKAGKVGRSDRRGESSYPPPPERGTTPATPVVHDADCGTTPASRARLDPSRAEPIRSEPNQAEPSHARSAGKPRRPSKPEVLHVELAELPEPIRSADVVAVLGEFLVFRKTDLQDPVTPIALRNLLLKLEPHGTAVACAALRESMSNGWKGVFPEKCATRAPRPSGDKPASMREWFARQTSADAQPTPRTVDVSGGVL